MHELLINMKTPAIYAGDAVKIRYFNSEGIAALSMINAITHKTMT